MPTKSQAQTSVKNINTEILSLTPSTMLVLWEIDASTLIDDYGLKTLYEEEQERTFRFHNSIKLPSSSIRWRGKDYVPAPIKAEGFEFSSKGSPTAPKLSISVNDDGIPALGLLKSVIRSLNDLTGAKVTRHRVFAKYIDVENFYGEVPPDGFVPDTNAYFAPDVYYIDRKTGENKAGIEFELNTIFDIEGVKLPARIVSARRCTFLYRSPECNYEYSVHRNSWATRFDYPASASMLNSAPVKANSRDELIQDVLGRDVTITEIGEYTKGDVYSKGHVVWLLKDGIRYYFVARQDNTTIPPPNDLYWMADECSRTIAGCRIRYLSIGDGSLHWGGFPGVATASA